MTMYNRTYVRECRAHSNAIGHLATVAGLVCGTAGAPLMSAPASAGCVECAWRSLYLNVNLCGLEPGRSRGVWGSGRVRGGARGILHPCDVARRTHSIVIDVKFGRDTAL